MSISDSFRALFMSRKTPRSDGAFSSMISHHDEKGVDIFVNRFSVVVPYKGKLTIQELTKQIDYNVISSAITDVNFPQEKSGDESVEIRLVHINRLLSFDEVIRIHKDLGFRPANVAELLSLAVQFPSVQREFPVVALGQTCNIPSEIRVLGNDMAVNVYKLMVNGSYERAAYTCLTGNASYRYAGVYWVDQWFSEECRFACVELRS